MCAYAWPTMQTMTTRRSAPLKGIAATVLTVGFVASVASPAISAPTPRVSPSQCSTVANNSGGTGYVIVDTTTNTSCVVKANGTFVWSSEANACLRQSVKFKGSLLPITNRGDVVAKVKVRYIRGNKVIKKTIKLRPGRSFATKQQFTSKGTWTAAFSYKGKIVTTKVKVKSC